MEIQKLIKKIEILKLKAGQLRIAEQAQQVVFDALENEISSAAELISYFDKVEDNSRCSHDLDVADAARNAFSRYCETKHQAEVALDPTAALLYEIQKHRIALDARIDDLEWELAEALDNTA